MYHFFLFREFIMTGYVSDLSLTTDTLFTVISTIHSIEVSSSLLLSNGFF